MSGLKIILLSLIFTSFCSNMYSQMVYPDTKVVKQTDDYHELRSYWEEVKQEIKKLIM